MPSASDQLTRWVYRGVWSVLTAWFRVPAEPPTLPVQEGETVESFRPAPGFLRYMKFHFWILLFVIDSAILIGWIAITLASPTVGAILAIPALIIAVVPDVIAYIAIHLRYDTTWYVMTDRSLRIRRGIWVIRETTITFENIQNVGVNQGPLQRWFGIGNVVVETAGGGVAPQQGAHGASANTSHQGLMEGIADAQRIRDQILRRLRGSRSAGLGDDLGEVGSRTASFSSEHLAVLRQIRDVLQEAS